MKKLTRNFLWMAAANITSGLIHFLLSIYIARTLGAARFGKFAFAQAIVFYMFNLVDLGLSTFGTREVAKNTSRLHKYVNDIISCRFMISAGLYSIFVLLVLLSHQANEMKILMAIMATLIISSGLASEWAFQGLEKMHLVFISLVATALLQLALVFLLVNKENFYIMLPAILFLATLPIIVIYLRILKFRFRIRSIDFPAIRIYFSSALVIWAIAVFAQIYNGFDVALMGWLRPAAEVGYFTVARRITGGLTFLAIFLAGAALPRYAASYKEGVEPFRANAVNFLRNMVLITILLLVVFEGFSRQVIQLSYGAEYLPADTAIKMLMVGVALVFLSLPFSTALIAVGLEREVLKQAAASAVLNIGINLILIPRLGMEGAAISFVCAEALALVWVVLVFKQKILLKQPIPAR